MKQRLADYVADFLAARGVTDVFSVVYTEELQDLTGDR